MKRKPALYCQTQHQHFGFNKNEQYRLYKCNIANSNVIGGVILFVINVFFGLIVYQSLKLKNFV